MSTKVVFELVSNGGKSQCLMIFKNDILFDCYINAFYAFYCVRKCNFYGYRGFVEGGFIFGKQYRKAIPWQSKNYCNVILY